MLNEFTLHKGKILGYSSNYYPQGNGVVESTNKNMIHILKQMVVYHQRNVHNAPPNALCDNRVAPKASLGTSPYFLVYGKEANLPPNILFSYLQLYWNSHGHNFPNIYTRVDTLLKLK
jgi:hypothetical protein